MRILSIYNLNQVAEMYQEDLAHRGHSVAIFEPSLAGAGASLPLKLAMMPQRIFHLRHVLGSLHPTHYDLVHIHWASYGLVGLASRIPYVIECHGSDVRYRLQHPLYRPVIKRIFNRAASVHCITPDLLPVVQSVCPSALFFPGPVDTDRFTITDKAIEDRLTRQWTILLFTRLDPIKGPEIAVNGIARFLDHYPNVQVKLLDWGKLKEKFKRNYGERFEFISPVPPANVQNLLHSVDVVVGQCRLGILSFCELQAMSCAKPVITSFSYPEAYPTPPPLCQAARPEDIYNHLQYLFHNQEAARNLGKRARAWVISNHSRGQLAARLEEHYQSILTHQDVYRQK